MRAAWRLGMAPAVRIAASTPADRDRVIDAVRATSLLVVVFGHWLVADVRVAGGAVRASNVLDQLPALHAMTWLLQVMPLFFVAGGFANATVWRRVRRRGGYAAYLRDRMGRLLPPVVVFALLVQGALGAAWLAGLPAGMAGEIARALGRPLWFLAVYLVVTALAPAMCRWHERAPVLGLVVLAGVPVAADLARTSTGVDGAASVNYLLVWLFAQQLGFCYADGRLARVPPRALVATVAAAVAVLALLTLVGPYPVSMVGVAGEMSNMNPPSICLVLLATAQTALVVAVRPRLRAWLERPRVWTAVVSVGARAMTCYLWHLVALVAVLGVAVLLEARQPPGGTVEWWTTRPLWLAAFAVALVAIALPVSRLERRRSSRPRREPVPHTAVVLAGLLLATAGLIGYATSGLEPFGPAGEPVLGLPAVLLPNSLCLLLGWLSPRVTGKGKATVR